MIHHPSVYIDQLHTEIIREQAAEAERIGKLTNAQLELAYGQQWFRLLTPKAYGGPETPLPDMIRIEEALSWADGSMGWVVTLCSGAGWFGGFIHPDAAAHIFNDDKLCLAGSGAATGTAKITNGGYVINGNWKYASGVHHATQITVNCMIEENGKMPLNAEGEPLILPFVLNSKDVKLLPGWKYMGMTATGSDAYEVNNLFVDSSRCFKIEPAAAVIDNDLYRYPFLQLAEATLAANLSGMAVHFIDLCSPVFKSRENNIRRVTDDNIAVMYNALHVNTELLNHARALFYTAVDASWANYKNEELLGAISTTSRLLAKTARECVDALYPYCGLTAAAPDTEINRVWRDLHTASQHSLLTFAK